ANTAPNSDSANSSSDDNGSYAVKGRIMDRDDAFSEYTTTVTINNVAPTATLSNNGPVNEASPVTVSFSSQLDPSAADTSAGFHYTFDCAGGLLTATSDRRSGV